MVLGSQEHSRLPVRSAGPLCFSAPAWPPELQMAEPTCKRREFQLPGEAREDSLWQTGGRALHTKQGGLRHYGKIPQLVLRTTRSPWTLPSCCHVVSVAGGRWWGHSSNKSAPMSWFQGLLLEIPLKAVGICILCLYSVIKLTLSSFCVAGTELATHSWALKMNKRAASFFSWKQLNKEYELEMFTCVCACHLDRRRKKGLVA